MNKIKLWKYIGLLFILIILIINLNLVFGDKSNISRSILLSDYERLKPETQRSYIEKDAILSPAQEIKISADATTLEKVSVRPGQTVNLNEEIAVYKTDSIKNEQRKLEAEKDAYKSELSALERILKTLEAEQVLEEPITKIQSEQIDNDLLITIETQIAQGSPIEAETILKREIASIERKLEYIEEQLSSLNFTSVLASPIDGAIGEVVEDNGIVTFVFYDQIKELIVYLTPDEWEQVKTGQAVELDSQLYDGEKVENTNNETKETSELLGKIVEKQMIPVRQSYWFDEMKKVIDMSQPTYYEVRINIDEEIPNKPYGNITKVNIIPNEAMNASRIEDKWVLEKEYQNKDQTQTILEQSIYTLNSEGVIRLTPISIAFKDNDETIFNSESLEGIVIIKDNHAKEYAHTFLRAPIEKPNKELLSQFTWKDYLKYLLF